MSNKYLGQACVICNQAFKESDDIVVCPECGSPHHRACYEQLGHCQNEELHGTGKEWTSPSQWAEKNEGVFDGDAPMRCPRCSTLCEPGTLFCPVCGSSLNMRGKAPQTMDFDEFMRGLENTKSPEDQLHSHPNYDQRYSSHGEDPSASRNNQTNTSWGSVPNIPPVQLNPYTTPYGGVSPDEEIDGIAAKDMVVYVGSNSHFYLPRFKRISEKRQSFQWNWAAFFFHFVYYFYRKMYLVGAIFFVAYLLSELPLFILLPDYIEFFYQQMTTGSVLAAIPERVQWYLNYSTISNFILLLLATVSASLANYLYFKKAQKDIRNIKQENESPSNHTEKAVDSPEYLGSLARKGRVNMRAAVLMLLIMGLINFVLPALMVLWFM